MDTEAALAILKQSFPAVTIATLLDVLVENDGDLDSATASLERRKRLKTNGVSGWLSKKSSTPSLPPQPPSPSKKAKPFMLSNPAMVEEHSPCTLHLEFLPRELANMLYLELVKSSQEWSKMTWYINEREGVSNHTGRFFFAPPTDEAPNDPYAASSTASASARIWFNGAEEPHILFSPVMQTAQALVEQHVNGLLASRHRFPLEYDGKWRANVCAANCYKGSKETVGFHSDTLASLGPAPTIASLSLGTTREFRLREVPTVGEEKNIRTLVIPLVHNSLLVMHGGCQEKFKHAVLPQNSIDIFKVREDDGSVTSYTERINLTFRFYRPDFAPADKDAKGKRPGVPLCKCGATCVLRPDKKGKVAKQSGVGTDSLDDMLYFWQCPAGPLSKGKSCGYFQLLDMHKEGRGPCIKDRKKWNVVGE